MWSKLQIFGFRALWSPYFLLYVLFIAIAYYLITGPLRQKFGGNVEKPTVKQQVSFYFGLFLLYVMKGSPIDLMSHILLMAHMIQMAFYYLVFPILIIRGIPTWVWQKVFRIKGLSAILRLFTKPLIAVLVFNGLFSIYHIPAILDYSKSHEIVHAIFSIILLFAAFCMWWPLFTPIKEQQTMKPLFKILYIFGNGVLITPACGLIMFSSMPLYATYSDAQAWINALSLCVPVDVLQGITLSGPELFSDITTLHDQQAGGIIMKVLQEFIYGGILAKVFYSWFHSENRGIDPIPNT
ncbi:cytochrome c oxidase assembly factor CtaG [Salirhabdus salicampi]|uniref:cytochrome c oxidase assembly factor CtaG n=1 Tax=Salirhabdus salicampi TaxID=476102 RepID=UPI0020C35E1C|nr:cytochrome c oxidase assembly factor CtaG [Salirhabdus salicampi]MCP8616639.1 cytochrome c oxidase assembly factor CtaG [Salirhabdus salicampi]